MRKELDEIGSETRGTFYGTFERFGIKNGYRGTEKTVLLKNIKNEDGIVVTDHLWFNFTKGFEKLNLEPGMVVQFDARVAEYVKGYRGWREDVYCPLSVDYKLSYPTKMRVIEN